MVFLRGCLAYVTMPNTHKTSPKESYAWSGEIVRDLANSRKIWRKNILCELNIKVTEIFWNLPLISRESQQRISFIYWLNYLLETRQIGDSQRTAYYIKGGGCKQNALCGFIKVVYFAKVVKFHVLYSLFFFLYFITVSGNYRWINMFQMMVYRMFCAGFLRIFIFGICYQKSEMTHNPVFFSYVVLFIFHLQYWWWNCIKHEIWLQLLSRKKINSVLEQGLL